MATNIQMQTIILQVKIKVLSSGVDMFCIVPLKLRSNRLKVLLMFAMPNLFFTFESVHHITKKPIRSYLYLLDFELQHNEFPTM